MKFITDISELKGKTIKNAVMVECDESMALIFTDETCVFIDVRFYGDSHEILLLDDVENYLKRDAEIITNEEYEKMCEEKKRINAEKTKISELEELARLKQKYDA